MPDDRNPLHNSNPASKAFDGLQQVCCLSPYPTDTLPHLILVSASPKAFSLNRSEVCNGF
jgi:hypothetical protein